MHPHWSFQRRFPPPSDGLELRSSNGRSARLIAHPSTGLDIPILTDATHTFLQEFRKLPGSSWVETAVDKGAKWIGNAAKTPEGTIFLDAITTSLAQDLSAVAIPLTDGTATVGPQLASVVFALPGVVAGKDFTTAYIQDLTSRIVSTAAILVANPEIAVAAANSFSPAIAQSINDIAASISSAVSSGSAQLSAYNLAMANAVSSGITAPLATTVALPSFHALLDPVVQKFGTKITAPALRAALRDAGLTAEDIARKLGIRPDVAALAINQYTQVPVYDAGAPPPDGAAEFDVNGQPNANYAQHEAAIGAPSPDVALAQAQRALSTLGLLSIYALGVAGPSTTSAIQAFQSSHGLPVTGLPDTATLSALQTAANAVPVTLTTTPLEASTFDTTHANVKAILANASGTATVPAPSLSDLLGTLLKATIATSPIWVTLLFLPRWLDTHKATGQSPRKFGKTKPSALPRARAARARSRRHA